MVNLGTLHKQILANSNNHTQDSTTVREVQKSRPDTREMQVADASLQNPYPHVSDICEYEESALLQLTRNDK